MYAIDFEYANERLSDYGMMICNFNSSGGTEAVSSGADITFSQAKASGSSRFSLYSFSYENAYTATFQICRLPNRSKAGRALYLTPDEVTAIQRWLCRREYHRFKIDQDGYRNIYWNAVFQSKQIMLNGQIAGLELTMYTDAPYAYLDEIHIEYTCHGGMPFQLYDESGETGYIRPELEITILSDQYIDGEGNLQQTKRGIFVLSNSMDNKFMQISNCSVGEVLNIDGKNQMIFSTDEEHDVAKDFNYFYPKIINTYDDKLNIYTPSLDCKIRFSYSPIRKIGL